jgi:glycosyltransferase involved in cell wall biosynthesis
MPEVLESDNALKEYGLVKGEYVLSVGRLVPEKGFHDLIEAFTDLKLDRWKLVIVGGADHEDKYSLGLKEKALARKNIVLTGFLTGKPLQELYSHAGLFVLPSYYEGLPIALLEAMSFGLSCIASDIPANRNIMLDKSRYFEIKNPSKLSRKMKEYIGSPLSIEEKIKQKNILAEKYDWRSIAAMTLEIYIEIGSTSSQ